MNWRAPQIVVRASQPDCTAEANRLAQLTGLPVEEFSESQESVADGNSSPWTLLVKPLELSLIRPDGLSVEIDFIRGKGIQRSREANFHSQPLARALSVKKFRQRTGQTPSIIDATAGFGTDGWMMASLGCKVQLLEASPVLAAMLMRALDNARGTAAAAASDSTLGKLSGNNPAHNISVINTDSVQYLNNHGNAGADIIYLDPMYPQTRSKALVKKGMQLLHELIGPDNNGAKLLNSALNKASYRVVVKRPKGAPPLADTTQFTRQNFTGHSFTEHNFTGNISTVHSANTRFDIYHIDRA